MMKQLGNYGKISLLFQYLSRLYKFCQLSAVCCRFYCQELYFCSQVVSQSLSLMNKLLLFLFLLLVSCREEYTANLSPALPPIEIQLNAADLQFRDLQLLPIVADYEELKMPALNHLKTTRQALQTAGFRITEKIPYGNRQSDGDINLLSIHNKTNDTIFLMAGEILQGGKQDRIIAQDMLVMPRSLSDVSVFCVEKNRWQYHPAADEPLDVSSAPSRQAFTGYYHLASNELRKTVKRQQNQEQVWKKVSELTAKNNAASTTGTYAALEKAPEFTAERKAYLDFFLPKFDQSKNVVGCIAINGNKIIGTDIFGQPDLFRKQYKSLIYSYITDAISQPTESSPSPQMLQRYLKRMKNDYFNQLSKQREKEMKFYIGDQLVHFTHF